MPSTNESPESQLLTEYLGMHCELNDVIHRLTEFVNSLPAPDDDDKAPAGVNWAYIGSLTEVAKLLGQAADMADEIQ